MTDSGAIDAQKAHDAISLNLWEAIITFSEVTAMMAGFLQGAGILDADDFADLIEQRARVRGQERGRTRSSDGFHPIAPMMSLGDTMRRLGRGEMQSLRAVDGGEGPTAA